MTWVLSNGNVGCVPDNTEEYEHLDDAVDSALNLFYDLMDEEWDYMLDAIASGGIYYFTDTLTAGADYVSVEWVVAE